MADSENINFLDLACLFKVEPETTLERFGTIINASVFDAANITGSLKQKGLIDFTAYYPGPNSILVTDTGTALKKEADAKSADALDTLDEEILKQMSGGKRFPKDLQGTLNIRSRDLAFRIYKLYKQSFLSYELKNGGVELMLTEQGFLKAKPAPIMQVPILPAQQQAMSQSGASMEGEMDGNGPAGGQMPKDIKFQRKGGRMRMLVVVIILLLIIVGAVLYYQNLIPQWILKL